MKEALKQIYFSLSIGKLSQKEALDRIEALKLQPQDEKTGLLLAAPLWRNKIDETCTESFDGNGSEQHIVFCDSSRLRDAELKLSFPRAQTALRGVVRRTKTLLMHDQGLYLNVGTLKRTFRHAIIALERVGRNQDLSPI